MPKVSYPVASYREAARSTFLAKFLPVMQVTQKELDGKTVFSDGRLPYWRFGCAFDTMTDYLWLLRNSRQSEDEEIYSTYKDWCNAEVKKDWPDRVDPYAQYLKGMVQYGTACCYDDFCWWGIASAKALPGSDYHSMFIDLFGDAGTRDFQIAAQAIWPLVYEGNYEPVIDSVPLSYPGYSDKNPNLWNLTFKENYSIRHDYHAGSPNAWQRVQDNKTEGLKAAYGGPDATVINVEPRYPNGMWQYDYYWDGGDSKFPESCGQCGDPTKENNIMGPFQLTLMSGLMLVYAARLYSWTAEIDADRETYLSAAKDVVGFLQNWFTGPESPDERLLWYWDGSPELSEKAVVRERAATYARTGMVSGYWQPTNRVWCGDQGLILGGLVDAQAAGVKLDDPEHIKCLVKGTLGNRCYPKSGPGLFCYQEAGLQPFYPALESGPDELYTGHLFRYPDYWSGSGVFWRYLFQTFRTNSVVRHEVLSILDSKPNAIYQSAETAAGPWSPSSADLRKPWSTEVWDDSYNPLFKWFNPLAALTAAIYVMEAYEES